MLPTHKIIRVDKCVNINVILDTIFFIQTNVNSLVGIGQDQVCILLKL